MSYLRCSVGLYLQLFVGGLMSYLHYLCLVVYSGVQHILCCIFHLFFFVVCTFGIIQRLLGRTFVFGVEGKGFDFNSGCCNTYKQICHLKVCNNERHDKIRKIVKKRLKMPKG